MARTLASQSYADSHPAGSRAHAGAPGRAVFFRALVDLDTGGVAGIEAAAGRLARPDAGALTRSGPAPRPAGAAAEAVEAWGREVRDPAAYLVRGDLATRPGSVGAGLGVPADRIILMFDVAALFKDPGRSLDLLLGCKRTGARILLDNFDLDDPPARFMEMLPADILRVSLWRMPWHWEEARRREVLTSVLAYADNLLMEVAVEGVDDGGQRRAFKRLGVRYAQGGWRRDTLGLVPDPARPSDR